MNLSLALRIPITNIVKLTLIRNSSAVLVIHPAEGKDLILETMKRTEFIIYLISIFDKLQQPRPQIVQSQGLRLLKSEKKQEVLDFDPEKKGDLSKKGQSLFQNLISNNFLNSSAVGYLEKKSDSWFRSWTEKFCVLTNVGLLYYDDP